MKGIFLAGGAGTRLLQKFSVNTFNHGVVDLYLPRLKSCEAVLSRGV